MEAESTRPASIRDVAARAGVSRQTVSRVLNGLPGMTDATAERVRKVIDELDYRPNRAARILASSRHRTIGLITTAATMFGPASIKEAIERAARAQGYAITAVTVLSEAEDEIAEALDELMVHGVDGMIVIAPQERTWPLIQRRLGGKPSLTLQWQGGPANTVALEQREGALLAVRHLIGLGHRRILHLAGPLHWAEVEQRVEGYRQALDEAGLEQLPVEHGDWSADSGYAIGLRVLPARDATAVFVSNDQMAIGLLHAAHELGMDVPRELSVVGFDDIPEARHATPPLTSVRQEFAALGDAAITRIVALIEGRPAPAGEITDQTTLHVRESTAPPRV
ncbi:LacI family DNA-binding transcriptional regulator [Pseudolysinimonas kribbensis]|uniref:LacI family DNA-binding transcriptional regulator n=1 Tax=Pseudolysinimonas kribbensis TaxID=433641 RepID=UPI0031D2A0B9